jgi:SPP1 gp7 family putative phage head morphogenesis protein
MTLVFRPAKKPPQQQGGKVMTAPEKAAQGAILDAMDQAAAAMTIGSDHLMGKTETLVAEFATHLAASAGFDQFTAMLENVAQQAATASQPVEKATATLTPDLSIIDAHTTAWAAQHAATLVTQISDDTRDTINGLVDSALNGEMTVDGLAKRIRETVGMTGPQGEFVGKQTQNIYLDAIKNGSTQADAQSLAADAYSRLADQKIRERSKTIALTELSNANNAGHMIGVYRGVTDGYIAPGTKKEWSTAEDERTCPICRPMNGEIVDWDQPFSNGLLIPPAHIVCRCAFNDLPPDAVAGEDYKPLRSETEIYGDTVQPKPVPRGWVGQDLSQLTNIYRPPAREALASTISGQGGVEVARGLVSPEEARAALIDSRPGHPLLEHIFDENKLNILEEIGDILDGNYNGFTLKVGRVNFEEEDGAINADIEAFGDTFEDTLIISQLVILGANGELFIDKGAILLAAQQKAQEYEDAAAKVNGESND